MLIVKSSKCIIKLMQEMYDHSFLLIFLMLIMLAVLGLHTLSIIRPQTPSSLTIKIEWKNWNHCIRRRRCPGGR
nr:hypothetical protein [Tanacetum cinerariifolium]